MTSILSKNLCLRAEIITSLKHLDISDLTPVQSSCIPILMQKKDLIVHSATGTGKTLSYLIPLINNFLVKNYHINYSKSLILAPTRELANQIYSVCKFLTSNTKIKPICITGGENFNDQVNILKRDYTIVIATTGRLVDHYEQGNIDLCEVDCLILDEADRMLDLGFKDNLDLICGAINKQRQTCVFSATMSPESLSQVESFLNNPKMVSIETTKNIKQQFMYADNYDFKFKLLTTYLTFNKNNLQQVIVFTATKEDTKNIAQFLINHGYAAVALHGDLLQNQRNRTVNDFKKNKYQILVATDVVSRGFDIPNVSHVINFDLPRVSTEYIHRIGRTSRQANALGFAVSFVGAKDWRAFKSLELLLIDKIVFDAFDSLPAKFNGLASVKLTHKKHKHPAAKQQVKLSKSSGRKPLTRKRRQSLFLASTDASLMAVKKKKAN